MRQSHLLPARTVNDVHSKLNPTQVHRIQMPRSVNELASCVRQAASEGKAVIASGGRHAMGGQQFADNAVLIDMREMKKLLAFDPVSGVIEIEAGIQWPDLIRSYFRHQDGRPTWGIRQKQTGADRLTIGGAIAANIHGRGLGSAPFSRDVLELTVVDANGDVRRCSRSENSELFRLVVGGYGLFGIVASAKIQLVHREKVERVVNLWDIDDVVPELDRRQKEGHQYGDFQFDIDPQSAGYLRRGIISSYRPVEETRPIPRGQLRLSQANWRKLLYQAHVDKTAAFEGFTDFYLRSSGQLYWSDTHQLNIYLDDYHAELDRAMNASVCGSEMITELYVPPEALGGFMAVAGNTLREKRADLIYGTVRMIEQDHDSFLPWAGQRYACIIFNLHVDHEPDSQARNADILRGLIDVAIRFGGSYFLTYHRYARKDQVLACYPRFPEFLRLKQKYDPEERFQSEWFRFYRAMFSDELASRTGDAA